MKIKINNIMNITYTLKKKLKKEAVTVMSSMKLTSLSLLVLDNL